MYTIDRLKYKKYGFLSGIMSILLIVIGACSDDNSTGTDVWEIPVMLLFLLFRNVPQ